MSDGVLKEILAIYILFGCSFSLTTLAMYAGNRIAGIQEPSRAFLLIFTAVLGVIAWPWMMYEIFDKTREQRAELKKLVAEMAETRRKRRIIQKTLKRLKKIKNPPIIKKGQPK